MKELIYHWFGLRYVKCHECETLKLLLEQEKLNTKRLFEEFLVQVRPVKEPEPEKVQYEPIKPMMNMARLRQQLEYQDRVKAEQLANQRRTEELEKELKINED